jgi:hypothetical protein
MYRVQLFLGLDVFEHLGIANVFEDCGLPAVELAPFGPSELAERLAVSRGHLHDDGPVGTPRRFGPLYHFDGLAAHETLNARRSPAASTSFRAGRSVAMQQHFGRFSEM